MAYNVKKEIEGFSGKSKTLVFNNIYSRNDFILITNTDRKGIEDMYGIVPGVLKKRFGTRIRMFISQSYFSFDKIYNIYSEACLTLSLRHVNDIKAVYTLETTRTVNIKKRITSEQVRHLTFAIQSKNKGLVREIIFNEMGFNKKSLPHWLILEVSQSIEYLTGIFMHNFQTEAGIILSIENFNYLLNAALNSEDFDEMCSLLAQLLDDILPLHQNIGSSASMAKTITCVCEYIDEYYFRNISLSSLASIFSIERSYLCRSFKAYTGENLMLSIAKKRIQKAQEYIKQSVLSHDSLTQKELNLTEISDLVGYVEYSYFNRVFRKITGLSPSDYRAGFKEESEICAE
jgi:two-component system response regulator YesN